MIRVSIIGATGYTGGELLRYCLRHPDIKLAQLTSETYAGQPIHHIHKFLKGRVGLLTQKLNVASVAKDSDVVFLGLPHGASAKTAAALLDKGTRVIDLSADFRLRDANVYATWYGKHPVPSLLKEAVYGLPERYREEIKTAKLVANPGCYATTAILAGLPLVTATGALDKAPLIVDAYSGVSGAGRKLESQLLFSEANESIQAYGLSGHRHHPEIWQEWTRAAESIRRSSPALRTEGLIFTPHLAPLTRGIFATVYVSLAKAFTVEALHDLFARYYLKEPFVTVLPPGESPELKAVNNTNYCQIGISLPSLSGSQKGRVAIVMAALDNLVKGASGQAIQNMNLMFGLEETTGLL